MIRALSTPTKLKLIYLCTGMMFWYGIEQLFMDVILQDPNMRALTLITWTATMLAFTVPGGIIADKFGRKRTIIASIVLQFVAVSIFAISTTPAGYLIGTFFFGLYWSMYDGTVQAMLYDHLVSKNAHGEYAKHQGSTTAFGYIGAALANILSGIIAHYFGLRMPYLLSLPPILIALTLVISTKESAIKQVMGNTTKLTISLRSYLMALLTTIRSHRISAIYMSQIILGLFGFLTIAEFGQIYILSYGVSTVGLGLLWALVAVVVALTLTLVAHRLQMYAWRFVLFFSALLLVFGTVVHPLAIGAFLLVYAGFETLNNIATTELQHLTSSRIRATVLSTVGFIGNLLALPIVWLFNTIVQNETIYKANLYSSVIISILLLVTIICAALIKRRNRASLPAV